MQKDSQYSLRHRLLSNRLRQFGENAHRLTVCAKARTLIHKFMKFSLEDLEILEEVAKKPFNSDGNYTMPQLNYYSMINSLVVSAKYLHIESPAFVESLSANVEKHLNEIRNTYGVGFLSLATGTKFTNDDSSVTVTINSYNNDADVINVTWNNSTENWKPEKLAEFLIVNRMNEVLNED